jgi:hypothetical protein
MSTTLEFLTKRRSLPKSLKWMAIAVAVLLLTTVTVGSILGAIAVREAQGILGQTKRVTFAAQPSPAAIVCREVMTESCAKEAATRIGVPVGWIPPPPGYRLQWLAAVGSTTVPKAHRIAFEKLTTGHIDLQLETQPAGTWGLRNEQLGTFVENGDTVSAYRDLYGYNPDVPEPTTLTLRWQHDGIQYSMLVSPHFFLDRLSLNPSLFAPLVARIIYTRPS